MDNMSQAISTSAPVKKLKDKTSPGHVIGRVFLYLFLLVAALICVFPFYWMISTSFMTLGETINRKFIPEIPQWVNYTEAWRQAKFSKYFMNSVLIRICIW
jgi:ABC-type glycerol-3-phosphate transport system permease component